jgi:putative ABC transport system permease protein
MFVRLLRTIRLATKSVLLHKLRSGLTILGIVFGVFSVIAMLAIGEGASAQAQRQVLELGATNIIIRSIKPPDDTSQNSSGRNSRVLTFGLLRTDFNLLSSIPTVLKATPIREIIQEARFKDHTMNARLVGCTPEYQEMNHLHLLRGRFISEIDQQQAVNVAVIADEVVRQLFPVEDPLGKTVVVSNQPYQIIGITGTKSSTAAIGGSMSGQEFNKDIYIPIRTLQTRIGDLIVRRTTGSFSAELVELNQITLQVDDRDNVLPTSQVVLETLQRNHSKQKDYDVIVPLELLRQADQIRYIFNFVLGSIAAISLIVGGIGIMNIMLATVTERTREIGIRRALGARRKDIIEQFLTETIVLSGAGGLIGVALGLLTPLSFEGMKFLARQSFLSSGATQGDVAKLFLDMEPKIAWWSLPIAFGISVGIGIIFGVYPARSAAMLDPIEALRHE